MKQIFILLIFMICSNLNFHNKNKMFFDENMFISSIHFQQWKIHHFYTLIFSQIKKEFLT